MRGDRATNGYDISSDRNAGVRTNVSRTQVADDTSRPRRSRTSREADVISLRPSKAPRRSLKDSPGESASLRKKSGSSPKRRRSDLRRSSHRTDTSVVEKTGEVIDLESALTLANEAERKSDSATGNTRNLRNQRPSNPKDRLRQPIGTSVQIGEKQSGPRAGTGNNEVVLVEHVSKKRNPPPQQSSSPSIAARGSSRVRTPSILLSSHPGEKVQALHRSAASKNKQVAYCLRIVKDMLRLKDGFGFSKPIDQLWSVDQLPGYFEMVTNPMDLDTVRQRLESGYYLSTPGKDEVEEVLFGVEAFSVDMRLIFKNAQTYNRAGDVFFEAATRLREKFEARIAQMPSLEQFAVQAAKKNKKRKKMHGASVGEKEKKGESAKARKGGSAGHTHSHGQKAGGSKKKAINRSGGKSKASGNATTGKKKSGKAEGVSQEAGSMSVQDMEARLSALKRHQALTEAGSPASSPAAGGASYMAQAQALYHIPMTYAEKVQLSENVSQLPAEKLSKIIALATKNQASSMEVNNNEEIELDIDSMDNKTLREMEAYVNQTLFRRKKNLPGNMPNGDVFKMSKGEVAAEIEKLSLRLKQFYKGNGKSSGGGDGHGKKNRSFYDSDSSSDSDDSDGSDSSDESSSDDSDSSGDESEVESMKRRRERNLAHQQAMQAAGTPLPSPPYKGSNGS